MFSFGFAENHSEQVNDDNKINSQLNWFPAVEINVSTEQIAHDLIDDDCTINYTICDMNIQLIQPGSIVKKLKNNEHENIVKAESQHSDLIPAIYEGGLKVWECSHDLGEFLLAQGNPLENLKVLDLGCGSGILGIIALQRGAIVHFQDYNKEVIELLTIQNVLLNSDNRYSIKEKTKFYAGDWKSFTELNSKQYPDEEDKYDIILSSETIYNLDNQMKLYQVFKDRLKNNGVGYIAGKTYYFGVGGGMRQFEKTIKEDNTFNVENVWKSNLSVQREIIKLTWQKN